MGILVDLDDNPVQTDPDPTPDPTHISDLVDLFKEGPALDPMAQPFVPKRSRKPPQRYGHNVGYF